MTFQKHINGLRAIAVIAVMFYHFKVPGFSSGFVGVDVFFVISGYLITNILTSSKHTQLSLWAGLCAFYANRIRRIIPMMVVLSIVSVFVFGLTFLPSEYIKLLRSNVTAHIFFSNFFFRNQSSYFDTAAENNPLLHTWSLSLEWQFYFAYPFCLYAIRKLSVATKTMVISAMAVCSFAYCLVITPVEPAIGFFLPGPRVWEFLIGALVAICLTPLENQIASRKSDVLMGIGILTIACSLFLIQRKGFPGWQAAIPVVASALIIANGGTSVLRQALSLRPVQLVGDISYSLYLWHWPIYVFLVRVVAVDRPLTFSQTLFGMLFAVGLAMISYRWVELPCRSRKDYLNNRRSFGLTALFSGFSIALLAVGLLTDGMSFRLPDYMSSAEIAMTDKNPRRKECLIDRDDKQSAAKNPRCNIGQRSSAKPAVMLWADSFGDALQPMVEEVLSNHGITGVAAILAGCAPIDVFPYGGTSRESFAACSTDFEKNVFAEISTSPNLKIVIFSAFWQMYDFSILRKRLPEVVCTVKRQGKTPIVFGPTPVAEFDVPRTWGARQLQQRATISEISMSRDPINIELKKFKEIIVAINEQCGAVEVIQPTDRLCVSNKCFAVKDGKAIFYDQWHLSRSGASLSRTSRNQTGITIEA